MRFLVRPQGTTALTSLFFRPGGGVEEETMNFVLKRKHQEPDVSEDPEPAVEEDEAKCIVQDKPEA